METIRESKDQFTEWLRRLEEPADLDDDMKCLLHEMRILDSPAETDRAV